MSDSTLLLCRRNRMIKLTRQRAVPVVTDDALTPGRHYDYDRQLFADDVVCRSTMRAGGDLSASPPLRRCLLGRSSDRRRRRGSGEAVVYRPVTLPDGSGGPEELTGCALCDAVSWTESHGPDVVDTHHRPPLSPTHHRRQASTTAHVNFAATVR